MRFPTATFAFGFAVAGACVAMPAMAGDTKADDPALSGYVRTGETENCLRVTQIRSSEILNKHQILFKMQGGHAYLNEPRCSGLNESLSLSYEVTNNQLCTTTIVKLIDVGSPVSLQGSCLLGPFQKLEKKTADAQ